MQGDTNARTFMSAVRCRACGATVPLDVNHVRMIGGEPAIRCTSCLAVISVPVFTGDEWDDWAQEREWVDATKKDEPSGAIPADVQEADVQPDDAVLATVVDSEPTPIVRPSHIPLVERRAPQREHPSHIACRACGAQVELEAGMIRLAYTHAVVECPGCGVEVRLRRNDAYRDVDTELPWAFASYANEGDAPEPPEHRKRRWLRKG